MKERESRRRGGLRAWVTARGFEFRELKPRYWRDERAWAGAIRPTEWRDVEDRPLSIEGLRAWKQEYVQDEPTPGGGLPYTADNHVRIVRKTREMGMPIDVEKYAADFGIPREYWEAVVRYVEAEENREQP